MAEAEAVAAPVAAPEASPAAPAEKPTGATWSYDPGTGVVKVNGKEFKLALTLEQLGQFADAITEDTRTRASTLQALSSLRGLVAGFERGEWKNYTNAGQRIKILHQEVSKMEKELQVAEVRLKSRAAEFGKLFEPAGLWQEFGDNSAEYTKLVKAVLLSIAKA